MMYPGICAAANSNGQAIAEWVAGHEGTLTNLVTGLTAAQDVAVDGSGNVSLNDNGATLKWTPTAGTLEHLAGYQSGYPLGVAMDSAANASMT